MCGIAGSFHPETDAEDPWVAGALDGIAHRGPDGRGILTWTATTHGHVRLSILDPLPRSGQPFVYGGVLLSYVGECWNFRELRAELEADGYRFRTDGDTEVVAALCDWALGGRDLTLALERMDWQGVLAVTESVSGRTWVARDRLGETPLYVLREQAAESLFDAAEGIRWSSERRVFGPLAARAEPVPAGHCWRLGEDVPEAYWRLPTRHVESSVGPADVLRLLREAVRRRLQADVPVACLCSGGLDSSLILALVREQMPDVIAYHVTADMDSADLWSAYIATRHLGVPLRILQVDRPGRSEVEMSVRAIEVVTKTQVEIGTLAVPLAARLRQDGFRVCLSGEGADELFGGYGTLARRASADLAWVTARREFLEKMARSDLIRVNKAWMSAGVEPRTPFLDRDLVEEVLPLGVRSCPPGKGLLKRAAVDLLPSDVIDQRKRTFQGGAGVADHLDQLLAGTQRRTYNEIGRRLFGGIPRG